MRLRRRWGWRTWLAALAALSLVVVIGFTRPAEAATTWLYVDADGNRTCAIRSDRTLWCWGWDWWVGDFGRNEFTSPRQVGDADNWATVSVGDGHACTLTTGGRRYCVGLNAWGELGLGDTAFREEPSPRGSIERHYASVSAGGNFTCGVNIGASLMCWGYNHDGQLGLGTNEDEWTPALVDSDWLMVSTAHSSACGVKTNGTRYCWGWNGEGELGLGDTVRRKKPAARDGETLQWRSVSFAGGFGCGVLRTGYLYCWGGNDEGQLGLGDRDDRLKPVKVGTSDEWRSVSTGGAHACGLVSDGTRYCWGSNDSGELGIDDTTDRTAPRRWSGEFKWSQIAVGGVHSCGIRTNGALYCWGNNDHGQLGLGDWTERALPTRV